MRKNARSPIFPIAAAILLLSRSDAAENSSQTPAALEPCKGYGCYAEFVVNPLPGWTITPFVEHGRGLSPITPNECVPCEACRGEILWSYSGSGEYRVSWPGGYVRGDGPGHGDFRVETDCEAVPEQCRFEILPDSVFQGRLSCICHG